MVQLEIWAMIDKQASSSSEMKVRAAFYIWVAEKGDQPVAHAVQLN